MLTGGTIIRYLFGQAEAIRTVASARSALVTGIILVFLTSIARNYDQTHISESPGRWVFGSLLFSLVSGTWLYVICYGWIARLEMEAEKKPSYWSGWRGFMGVFWLTAPVAWLYAIPVERYLDSLSAAKANLILLGVVSVWRVLLMARVFQVLCAVRFAKALCWVLAAAAGEVLIVSFFGTLATHSILKGMAGLRNSPEEDVFLAVVSWAFKISLIGGPAAFVIGWFVPAKGDVKPLPVTEPARMPYLPLATCAAIWLVIAAFGQRKLENNVMAEHLFELKDYGAMMAFVSAKKPQDFAPSRVLPPKAYEYGSFEEVPKVIGAMTGRESPWVRQLMVKRLDQLADSLRLIKRDRSDERGGSDPAKAKLYFRRRGGDLSDWPPAIRALERFPEGQEWVGKKPILLWALANEAADVLTEEPKTEEDKPGHETAKELAALLKQHGIFHPEPVKENTA